MDIRKGVIEINEDAVHGKGEDASMCVGGPAAQLIAVLDGCGGSGARTYESADGWTGARLASHLCAEELAAWFQENRFGANGLGPRTAEAIAIETQERLRIRVSELNEEYPDRGLVRGSLSLKFPTTLAAAVMECRGKNEFRIIYLWAGDSRGYLLTASGLYQITRDDLSDGSVDAIDNITQDSAISNLISASRDFTVHCQEIFAVEPCLPFVATDGCFSYLQTPMDFEGLLLTTLQDVISPEIWKSKLEGMLKNVAQDDFTLTMSFLGYETFSAVKQSMQQRTAAFLDQFGQPLETMRDEASVGKRIELWKRYKENYEKLMGK